MPNNVLRLDCRKGYLWYAILDTPCFPARYYAGPVQRFRSGEWLTGNNDTSNFHRDLVSATEALNKELARLDKEIQDEKEGDARLGRREDTWDDWEDVFRKEGW